MKLSIAGAVFSATFSVSVSADIQAATDPVSHVSSGIVIDGNMQESAWHNTNWREWNKHILGSIPAPEDFSGRYKLLWDEAHLYLLAEITDDVLFDQFPDPLVRYWDDDCLEIFVDEDASGGEHQFNFNAFAYHLALDNQAVDIGRQNSDGSPQFLLLNDHLESRWKRQSEQPNTIIWEVAIKLFADDFDPAKPNQPVTLTENKQVGFMLAYCDNDGSKEREHFIGSHEIVPIEGDKNLGYKDASVFGTIKLVK